jgi:tRNA (guanine-N7-)-methyltransferase
MSEPVFKQERHPRTIRSFVKRGGRIPPGAKKALEEAWQHYGIELDSYDPNTPQLDFGVLFGQDHPVILEIGFGMGHSLLAMAEANPHINYLGAEVHEPGIARVIKTASELGLKNIKIARVDAVWMLQQVIRQNSLFGVQIFFPDPWHKKRHEKRRLINPEFISLLYSRLVLDGWVHVATDWVPYAEQVESLFSENTGFRVAELTEQGLEGERPETKFERRGLRLGHEVRDLKFQKRDLAPL